MLQRLAKGTALLAGLFCTAAYSLGLGDIQVSSRLNQTLSATIPLTSLDEDDAESLRVQIASPADFEKAGLERDDYLSSLKFSVSGSTVRISSGEIAREPVIALLIEARTGNSRVLRGYTVLLDLPAPPAGSAGGSETGAAAPANLAAPGSTEVPSDDASPLSDAALAQSAQRQQPESYGPIRSGQTFWSVATQLRPDPSLVSMDQTLLALYTANPQAFFGGINGLLIGSNLRVPTVEQMRAVPELQARRRVQALRSASSAPGSLPRPAADAPPPPVAVAAETPIPPAAMPEVAATAEAAPAAAEAPATSATEPAAADVAAPPAGIGNDGVAQAEPAQAAAVPAPSTPPPAPPVVAPTPVQAPSYPLSWALALLGLALLATLVLWRRRRQQPATAAREADLPAAAPTLAAAEPAAEETASVAAAAEPAAVSEQTESPAPAGKPSAETLTEAPAAAGSATKPGDDAHELEIDLAASDAADEPSLGQLDPLAEADFHLSYGLYDEAVRGLIEAIAEEPERNDLQLKLAETYFAAGRSEDFESLARRIQPRMGPSEWGRLIFMGSQLCPDSPLFREAEGVDHGNGIDFELEPRPETPPAVAPAVETGNRLEFELRQFDATAPIDVASWHTQAQWQMAPSAAGSAPAGFDLSKPGVIEFEALPDIDPNDIDLYEAEPEVEIATDDEVGTKLDLARAYLDMGDSQMARDLLSEVVVQGNARQQAEAYTLLQRLPA